MNLAAQAGSTVHGTALAIGEVGLLIEGDSGSGKSSLAAALLRDAARRGCFGRLVGDDRVAIIPAAGRLIARPHPAIAGLLEVRGVGLVAVAHEPACVLHLVVRLLSGTAVPTRWPERPPLWACAGIFLPMLVLPAAARDGAGMITDYLARRGVSPILEPLQSPC